MTTSPQDTEKNQERFLSYQLSGLLPEDCKVILDEDLKILTQLRLQEREASIVEQQQFTETEWAILREIVAAYPYYCPLANLLSAHWNWSLERSQKAVLSALEEGDHDGLMRPVRNVLSRARIKLRFFGVDARSVLETGYILMPAKQSRE